MLEKLHLEHKGLLPKRDCLSDQRMKSAAVRAIDAHAAVFRLAAMVIEDLEDVTSPHGIPVTDLSEEDSAVIVIDKMLAAHQK
jgi:hypothetical protein